MDKKDLLGRLVKNGLDFLSHSIEEFEGFPKYSVIHFYAAVELLLKARLMSEHWSLVVSKQQEPDWERFIAGDFQSVALNDAANRLQKAACSGLADRELRAFRAVRTHRNKMVHFFHETDSAGDDKLRETIAREQLSAWYLLHRLLADQWRDVFEPWSEQIGEIDQKLRERRKYLHVVFDQLAPDIKEYAQEGFVFRQCPSCEFMSQRHEQVTNVFYTSICLVCRFSQRHLAIPCPQCAETVDLVDEGFAECDSCGKHLEPEHVVDALIDHDAAHRAAREGDDSWDLANCGDCGSYHTVVRVGDAQYVCTHCFGEFESLQWCGWCNEPSTGDMDGSHVFGCGHCEGLSGWDDS
ncbi:hypothetical protein [Anaerobaca lacustris]|uniref:HsdR n=1 Tax=Anaerobaca lacustris TaxID=3044600 RepID=A0AAW6U1G8_9BACT|nr:hypothetical protein [Sedimentisphaerales bacterium M17dextr]